jgi:multidrug resistance efflux pump
MENPKESIFKKPWVQSLTGIVIIILIVSGTLLYKSISSYISIDEGTISAPVISIAPETSGALDEIYVKEGDEVTPGQSLARVGSEILTAKVAGIIIYTNNTPGQFFTYASPVIKMIDPNELRVIGTIKEDAGLTKISVGNPVTFTLDAFGNKEFTGVVEEISETAKDTSVVFSISDKREIKDFTIKIKYDTKLHPEFKNSMSAKIKVYNK